MSDDKTAGQVITFYSYKGGTGRSMALANVGCVLADRSEGNYRVLMVDWDLEAPGLHRYFPTVGSGTREGRQAADSGGDGGCPGVIELFQELEERTRGYESVEETEREEQTSRLLEEVSLKSYVRPTQVDALDLMPAGRFDDAYASRVNTFRWERFYQRVPWMIGMLAERLARHYRYVLIDSRTGLTDTSGICTMLLPEKLVAVFTPNEQSLGGVVDLVRQAVSYRRQSDDLRKLVVFPLASRVEITEPKEKDTWRLGTGDGHFEGYQTRFEGVLKEVYGLVRCDLTKYFDEVEIQHASFYAYGEKIAALQELSDSVVSLSQSYQRFTDWLTRPFSPWEKSFSEADVLRRYRDLLLQACDIIDLSNLPESDHFIAVRQIDLRLIFVPRRLRIESQARDYKFRAISTPGEEGVTPAGPAGGVAGAPSVDVGEQLRRGKRLVMLGEPGAGKTTIIRWVATAYLLGLKRDPNWVELPGVSTLPDEDLLPVLIRCRDLGQKDVSGSFTDLLRGAVRRLEVKEEEFEILGPLITSAFSEGRALLLVDGLEEIADLSIRTRFCQQIERLSDTYPAARIIVTARISDYREMSYRFGGNFEHAVIAELSSHEKDVFIKRWSAVVEPAERRGTLAEELQLAVHSTDRVNRLTGNPMLLSTLALVSRKVGRLPTRRTDLYWNMLGVLLNWRPEVDEPLDEREAVPQLEYLAYAMCERGLRQIREDEILELLDRMRDEYPRIHAIRRQSPEDFLRRVEHRTGLLIEAGTVRHLGRPSPVYEFSHVTFQEYLAALALVDGRFPGHDPARSLHENVASLAGRIGGADVRIPEGGDGYTWVEVLRLCVSSCNDEDVDGVMLAILNPQPGEDERAARRRAVTAALCLADEPNVSEQVAQEVLREYVRRGYVPRGSDPDKTEMVRIASEELKRSRWGQTLSRYINDVRQQ